MKLSPKSRPIQAAAILAAMIAFACATTPPPGAPAGPLPLDAAIRSLAQEMLTAVEKDPKRSGGTTIIAMAPFRVQDTQEVVTASRSVEAIFREAARPRTPRIDIRRLDRRSLQTARYLIDGAIRKKEGPSGADDAAEMPAYAVSATLHRLETDAKVHSAAVQVAAGGVDTTPVPLYADSPVFFRDWRKGRKGTGGSRPLDALIDRSNRAQQALLTEAETAYGQADYKKAAALFKEAAQADAPPGLPFYAGLYAASMKMGRLDDAEAAFGEIVRFSVEKYNMLTVKFLFEVNSATFIGGEKQRRIYEMWLRRIGRYFSETGRCLRIVGHTSPTGPESWNDELSRRRAETIRGRLINRFDKIGSRSRAEGRGSRETIIGIGADDARDALDRRVEIVPVACQEISH